MSGLFSAYFTKLFCICACSLVCEIVCISIGTKNNSVFQSVKIICSLCICIIVFSAFFNSNSFIESIDDISNNISDISNGVQTSSSENEIIKSVNKQIENELSKSINKKTGIKPVSLSIQLDIESENDEKVVDFKNVQISLPQSATEADIYIIKSYIQGILGCETQVTGEIKE